MKPSYSIVRRNYYLPNRVDRQELFAEIGHPGLGKSPAWVNTCAIRLSLALVKSDVVLPGHMVIQLGKYKGRRIEQNVVRLAGYLTTLYGKPEEWDNGSDASAYIGARRGIVAFFALTGPIDDSNHIDLVSPTESSSKCANACYWRATKFQFWQLPY